MARHSLPLAQTLAVLVAVGLPLAACASGGATETPAESPPPAADAAEETVATPAETAAETPETPPDAAPETPAGGIFTDTQAQRGRTTFDEVCSECHTTSEFRGRTFQRNWGRRTVYSFFRTIRSTMPDDNPGGLEEQVYLDVVSYILSMNGHEGGAAELDADSPMRDVRIAPAESSR